MEALYQLPGLNTQEGGGQNHEEGVVVHDPILAQLGQVELLLGHHPVGRREHVADQDVRVPDRAEPEVVSGGQEGAEDHEVDGHLHWRGGLLVEHHVLADHGHEDGEPPEDGEHGEGELLGAAEAEEQVAEVEERQGPDLAQGLPAETWEGDQTKGSAHRQDEQCGEHLTKTKHLRRQMSTFPRRQGTTCLLPISKSHLKGGEAVDSEDLLVDHHDEEGGDGVEDGGGELQQPCVLLPHHHQLVRLQSLSAIFYFWAWAAGLSVGTILG